MSSNSPNLNSFKKKLREKYWTRGSVWEFDWYLDAFFVEIMAYGSYPEKLNFEQPVVGDEFLNFSGEDSLFEKYKGFFESKARVKKLIRDQKDILASADKLLVLMKKRKFDSDEYEKVQKDLSLLMALVSVVLDKLISKEVNRIAREEGMLEPELVGYIVDHSAKTRLHLSNKKLLSLYRLNKRQFEKSDFQFKGLDDPLKKKLIVHADKYGWLNTGERGKDPWSPQDFLDQLRALVQKKGKRQRKVSLDKLSKRNRELMHVFSQVNLYDNSAADRQIELDYLFQKYLREKLGRYYLASILENLTYSEILKVLEKPESIHQFKNRKNNYKRVVWPEKDSLYFHYFDDKDEFRKLVGLIEEEDTEAEEITGTIACGGMVKGNVRIVEKESDFKDFQEGEILVAPQTQPRYVVVMRKAGAIITDVGGATSHAAIVSREFGIPCIVGTRNATKKLKNGDYVLVDAEEGKVIKLEGVD